MDKAYNSDSESKVRHDVVAKNSQYLDLRCDTATHHTHDSTRSRGHDDGWCRGGEHRDPVGGEDHHRRPGVVEEGKLVDNYLRVLFAGDYSTPRSGPSQAGDERISSL